MTTWTPIGFLSAATDLIIADIIGRASASRDIIDARIDLRVDKSVETAIASSQTVKDAAVAAMSDAAVQARLAWLKPGLTSTDSLNDLYGAAKIGLYPTHPSSPGAPFAKSGFVEVTYESASGRTRQMWRSALADDGTFVARTYANGVWSGWSPVGVGAGDIPSTARLNDYQRQSVVLTQSSVGTATTARDFPVADRGTFISAFNGGSFTSQTYITIGGRVFTRQYYQSWQPWVEVKADTSALESRIQAVESAAGSAATGIRSGEHDMRVQALRQRIGRVSTGGKAAVALICDHGSLKFESIVLPLLKARGMKATLAMCPEHLTMEPQNEVASWDTIKAWTAQGVEVACHSKTHADATGVGALREEIIGGRDALSAALGGYTIDSWVQPGPRNPVNTTVGTYDGFKDGSQATAYYSTAAGEMIYGGYAVHTGANVWGGNVWPLDGRTVLGPGGNWLDGGQTGIDKVNADIDAAIAQGGRTLIRLHPGNIDLDGTITSAQLAAFLDSLKSRIDAGTVVMLQLREWGIAEG